MRPTIVKTLEGHFYRVTEPANAELSHCYDAVRVIRKSGEWVDRKGAREMLLRKVGTAIFPADASEAA